MSKESFTSQQSSFVDEVAALLVPWGMSQVTARIYGYLLLRDEPVSLDQIAEDLEVSKSSASVSARILEQYLLAKRQGVRGSKRVLYSASDNYSGLFSEQSFLLGQMGTLLEQGKANIESRQTLARLEAMSKLYMGMQEAINAAIAEFGRY
jgi:predicted transcriptional regulator